MNPQNIYTNKTGERYIEKISNLTPISHVIITPTPKLEIKEKETVTLPFLGN